MKQRLKGKVAVVTGSGRGLGRAVVLALAEQGVRVVVNDLGTGVDGVGQDIKVADQVVQEIKDKGGEAASSYDTVATMEGGEKIIKRAVESFGRIDILVNCAGILRDRMVWNMTEEEWDAVIDTHLKGHFACVKPASILMRQQRSGRIINFASGSGIYGNPGQANYSAAKGGILGFTQACSLALGRYGVTVNAICPGGATRMGATIPADRRRQLAAQRGHPIPPNISDDELSTLIVGDPADVAPIVVYLATDEAANVNGQVFYASKGKIALYAPVTEAKTIEKNGRWTLDELYEVVPKQLTVGLVNRAPPQTT